MRAVHTLEIAEKQAENLYGKQKRIVGLMLANYEASLVREIMGKYFLAWSYEAKQDLDVFWVGYHTNIEQNKTAANREKTTFIVGLNPTINTEKLYRFAEYRQKNKLKSLANKLDNKELLAFDRQAYLDSKKEIRLRMSVSKSQRIDSLTLLLVEYADGRFHFENGNFLAINLRELSRFYDPVTEINDFMSLLFEQCRTTEEFNRLLKKIRKEIMPPKEADVKGWIGVGISIINTILSVLSK